VTVVAVVTVVTVVTVNNTMFSMSSFLVHCVRYKLSTLSL